MRKSQYSEEQIVKIVRESHAQGVAETAKKYKISENSIYITRRAMHHVISNRGASPFGHRESPPAPNILHSVLLGQLGNGDVLLHGLEATMAGDTHDNVRTLVAFER